MGDGADDAYRRAMEEIEEGGIDVPEGLPWWEDEDQTAWVLPADRRLRLYRRIARSARGVPGAQGMRRQALEYALEARAELQRKET